MVRLPFEPKAPRDRLVFALDVDDLTAAERLVRLLSPHVGCFKVGSQLFTAAGPLVVDLIHGMGASVFLDLKYHDIPATVAEAVKAAARQRVRMLTVHAMGGRRMIAETTRELQRLTLVPGVAPTLVLGVTLLTSLQPAELEDIGFGDSLLDTSVRLARIAIDGGAAGVVASAQELERLRRELPPDTVYVTPGIRPPGVGRNDQARVMTPGDAIRAGATYLVVGRPIRDAADPEAAARRIVDDIAAAL